MNELRIEYLSPDELTPYENNTRKHTPDDIEGIKTSILRVGFDDPIGIWGDKNVIVEGHGRCIAAKELRMEKVPCIRLDHLTEDQFREYAIRHNRSAEMSGWDFDKLAKEIAALEIEGINLDDLNFEFPDIGDSEPSGDGSDGFYTDAVNLPQYEPVGECPSIAELMDTTKYDELYDKIENADIDEGVKYFLKYAAARHIGFNYKTIANFYAHQPKEIQELMEDSALVLIDINDAIRNGYAELSERLDEIEEIDDEEE